MTTTVVVGLQWGDEGKGKIVDYLAKNYDIVVRFSGGANAGHTVVYDGTKVLLSLIPSGILQKHTSLVITEGVVIDPHRLFMETNLFKEKLDFDVERLYISPLAPITFPYHSILAEAIEKISANNFLGTTGSGNGPTRADQVSRQAVRLFEYLDPKFMQGIPLVKRLSRWTTHAPLVSQFPNSLIPDQELYNKIRELLASRVIDTISYINNSIKNGKNVLFEGSQGSLLDVVYGFYPYVTASHCVAGAVTIGTGVGPTQINEVVGVFKAYSSRISNGPMVAELSGDQQDILIKSGHEYLHLDPNKSQRVGWLDLVALRYTVQLNGPKYLALTKLDALDPFDEIKVCVAYKRDNKIYEILPYDFEYRYYEPVYETLEGWKTPTSSTSSYHSLHRKAQYYIKYIENAVSVPIHLVSVGPDRRQTFFLS